MDGITVANALAYANKIPIIGAMGDRWVQDGLMMLENGAEHQPPDSIGPQASEHGWRGHRSREKAEEVDFKRSVEFAGLIVARRGGAMLVRNRGARHEDRRPAALPGSKTRRWFCWT